MEVQEGNKLIAEFMGILLDPLSNTKTSIHFGSKTLQYHTSWDWLMPVVEKIRSVIDEDDYDESAAKEANLGLFGMTIFSPIQNVYWGCTQFIQWYNSQNKSL